jgi:regulator of protease activity HflC (stomatin/prohibitin superfamily)
MISIFLAVVTLFATFIFFKNNSDKIKAPFAASPLFWKGFGILIIGLLISLINPLKLERVDAGHVGIKVNLTGGDRGVSKLEYKTGWVVINSWVAILYEFPIYQQTIEYPQQQVITKGGFSATIHPKFNYSLKPGDVGDMFLNLRLDIKGIEQGWLQNAIVGAVNDVANKWSVDSIFNERERFEGNIVQEANKRLSKWFIISQLRTNIIPPPSLQASIEAKTKAIQDVQVAENQKLVAIADGQRKIAVARADSSARVIRAGGEAQETKVKQAQLTDLYIQYLKIDKWNGVLPSVQSGSGGIMLQLSK